MLNKPKFMSPSINMYGNSVIDLNSASLPFSCIVDGNEAITDFQIVISRLKDNVAVFDTGMQTLSKPFFPINNRNQNVVFSIDLKDYFATALVNSGFENSADAYYWAITFKNSNSGIETYSGAEVFYANDIPRVEIQYDLGKGEDNYKKFSNNLVYNGDTLKYSVGWESTGCSFENMNEGYLRLISEVNNPSDCVCYRNLEEGVQGAFEPQIVYCSAQVRGFKTNGVDSTPSCFISNHLLEGKKYLGKVHELENINDGRWHTMSIRCQTEHEDGYTYSFHEIATEIKNANIGDTADFRDVCVFNLTKIYGEGNEPSKEWCDKNLDSLRAAEITSKSCKFRATYSQAQNVPIKKYGWRLTDVATGFVITDTITQDQIYGIGDDISCACNGLMNKTKYLLEVYIETQNGYFDILQSMAFYTSYPVKNIDADFEVVALNDTAGIMLDWGNLKTTEGVVVGDPVHYVENFPVQSSASIEIPKDTSVVFEGTSNSKALEIDENSYVVLSFQTKKNENKILFEMYGEDEMSNIVSRKLETIVLNNSPMLQYTVRKGDIIASKQYPLSLDADELSWCVVTLPPLTGETIDFKLINSKAVGGLFPSEDLYPVDLCVYDESDNIIDGEYNKASESYDPNLSYFKLVNGKLEEYTYDETTWDSDWANLYCCLLPSFGEWDKLRN